MGIKIHGACDSCHRQSDLVVDERFCSEVCEQRARGYSFYAEQRKKHSAEAALYGRGFWTGVGVTVVICAGVAAFAYLETKTVDSEKLTKSNAVAIERPRDEQAAADLLRTLADIWSASVSNRAKQLEKP